jgi:Protein of unknown function (DUF2752)
MGVSTSVIRSPVLHAPQGVDRPALGLSLCCVGAAALGGISGADVAHPGAPGCLLRAVTGIPCPFCGLTHSMMALGQGNLGAAVAQNPLGLLVLPLAMVILVLGARVLVRGGRIRWPVPALWVGLGVVLAGWAVQIARYVA